MAKTPEWQERETGVPARTVRALARAWGRKRTYLGAGGLGNGFGGACRGPSGHQWARAMVCLIAMQGLGREGVNFGNLQWGAPVDLSFWFPGYAEGGISGDVATTATAIGLYQRMPHLMTMNTVTQAIPRLHLPEAIITGRAEGLGARRALAPAPVRTRRLSRPGSRPRAHALPLWRHQFRHAAGGGPLRAHVPVGQSRIRGQPVDLDGGRGQVRRRDSAGLHQLRALGHQRMDGRQRLCPSFADAGQSPLVTLQHKCIEPLGQSKSDYDIFFELAKRLGLGAYYSEGMTDLDWVKRMFDASDLPRHVSWKRFLAKGYYVVPAPAPAERAPVAFRWFYQGRRKDVPEPLPIAAEYRGEFGMGLGTPTGKFEFECESLKAFDAADPERPPILKYVRSPESGAGRGAPHATRCSF